MKFNMPLSEEDLDVQKLVLEEVYTTHGEDDFYQIDTASVELCMKIFERSFRNEVCPNCHDGFLEASHLTYYNRIIKLCKNCGYSIDISNKEAK
jgi:ribosomal protein S27AE